MPIRDNSNMLAGVEAVLRNPGLKPNECRVALLLVTDYYRDTPPGEWLRITLTGSHGVATQAGMDRGTAGSIVSRLARSHAFERSEVLQPANSDNGPSTVNTIISIRFLQPSLTLALTKLATLVVPKEPATPKPIVVCDHHPDGFTITNHVTRCGVCQILLERHETGHDTGVHPPPTV